MNTSLLGHITVYIVTDQVAWSVGRIVTQVSPAKTAEAIEMPFGLRTWEYRGAEGRCHGN